MAEQQTTNILAPIRGAIEKTASKKGNRKA
jgi:hypothetical protein